MNKSVEETRRELFEEAAFRQRYISSITRVNEGQFGMHSIGCPTKAEFITKDLDGNYVEESLNIAWWGFTGALNAVEIELPEKRCIQDANDMYEVARNGTINECRLSIESLNLGLKIK